MILYQWRQAKETTRSNSSLKSSFFASPHWKARLECVAVVYLYLAKSTMSLDKSIPKTSPLGRREASCAVIFPSPHPMCQDLLVSPEVQPGY